MNFADMMKLEWKDTDHDKIQYIRSKTNGHFKIKIFTPVREVLDYYKEFSIDTKYVFPMLLKNKLHTSTIGK